MRPNWVLRMDLPGPDPAFGRHARMNCEEDVYDQSNGSRMS